MRRVRGSFRTLLGAAIGVAVLTGTVAGDVQAAGSTMSSTRALSAADVPALVTPPTQGVRLIAIWSLDCAYCEENLAALRAYQQGHADVELVFVATDPVIQGAAIEARLAKAGLDDVPSRAYAEATPERINFVLDPAWGGETPRTLAIHADGSRKGTSGALNADRIAALAK